MKYIFLALFSVTFIGVSSYAKSKPSFEEIIKKDKFYIQMSHSNLAEDHTASTLVLSCVDFRFQDEEKMLLETILGLSDDYDEISLPGASLVLADHKFSSWKKTVEEIVPILEKLHGVHRIILLDHRHCGAYSLILGKDHLSTPESELKAHQNIMKNVQKKLKKKFPKMDVYCLLMGLDGTVENLSF